MSKTKFYWSIFVGLALLLALGCGVSDDDDDASASPIDDDETATDDDDNDTALDDDDDDDDDDTAPPPLPEPIDLVDMFTGTGGVGYGAAQLHPGPQMPNGMVRPGPDTSIGTAYYLPAFHHYAGYWFEDSHIRGFSQNRMIGTGDSDYGNVRLMPVLGMDNDLVRDNGYLGLKIPGSETAGVGYYAVKVGPTNTSVELTSGRWSTLYRFTYDAGAETPYLVLDLGGSIRPHDVSDAALSIDVDEQEISGSFWQAGEFSDDYDGLGVFFVARFSEPFADYGAFDPAGRTPQSESAAGDDIGAYFGFALTGDEPLLVKIGLSYISVDQARANLEDEIPAFDFPALVANNRDAWRDLFGVVEVTGGTIKQQRLFHTFLYRSFIMPTLFTEQGGAYIGFDDGIHQAEGFTYYTDMSLWDTFRTLHPLITLLDPGLSRDFVVSLLKMAEQGGYLPRWPQGKGYTGSMIGTHSDSVIGEAYLKGITDFDVDFAYDAMVLHATEPTPHAGRSDLEHYLTIGYCTTDNTGHSVSRTLEYAYDDHCIAGLAAALGHEEDAETFAQRATNYETLWHAPSGYFRGRDSEGNWRRVLLAWYPWGEDYTQGSARHWRWFVPHDVPGLVALFGDAAVMVATLDEFFAESVRDPVDALPNPYYWHGNQHDLQAAFMFNDAGRPDLTQKWSRHVLEHEYFVGPDGIAGNEDGGTLAAWYVWAAIGLFPLSPCTPEYQIGSPVFDEIRLHLPGGEFIITAENNSPENIYIQSARLNGEPLNEPRLAHETIAGGGTLELVMGPEPSAWGR
ncbi:MAG: GH92 family glycosyl hydrolase [Candidatus Lernaella stagnicola]|nr:GH92 family glycosyl hydrolase [Candidatus Lernaella stagnicola]